MLGFQIFQPPVWILFGLTKLDTNHPPPNRGKGGGSRLREKEDINHLHIKKRVPHEGVSTGVPKGLIFWASVGLEKARCFLESGLRRIRISCRSIESLGQKAGGW